MKWLWRFLGLVVVLVVLAVAALFLLPTDRIVAIAEDQFEASTGRSLTVDGNVRPSIWPVLGVTTGSVQIANAEWAGDAPMIEASRIAVGVDPTSILGDIRVTGVEIENPVIRLATNADGHGNWKFGGGDAAGGSSDSSGGGNTLLTLDSARITGGTVIFQPSGGAELRLDQIELVAAFPDIAGPAEMSLSGLSGGAPFSVEGQIGALAGFLNGQSVPVSTTISAGEAGATFDGVAGVSPMEVAGQVSAQATDLSGLFALLGQAAPDRPLGLGRDNIEVRASVAMAGSTVTLQDIDATLDQNRVQGRASVDMGSVRPVVDADLNLGVFDLSGMATGGGAETDAAGATTGWSNDPIDVSGLGVIDGRIAVQAASLKLGTSTIDALVTETTIENARAVTEISHLSAYDGSASGSLVLNGRDGFSTRLDIAGSAFAISRLLSELVGYDRIIAAGDLRLNVLGVGTTMNALMNSLNGDGAFKVGAGELLGLDIVGMLRNLDPSYLGQGNTTIFDEISGTFRIVDGVVINDDLRLTAPLFRATGSGQIGIGAQSLNLQIVPELLGGDNAGIRVPLKITGSWQSPKVGLDLDGAIRDRVEQEVRDRVEQEIGDSLEDTLKKGLGGLLNR